MADYRSDFEAIADLHPSDLWEGENVDGEPCASCGRPAPYLYFFTDGAPVCGTCAEAEVESLARSCTVSEVSVLRGPAAPGEPFPRVSYAALLAETGIKVGEGN